MNYAAFYNEMVRFILERPLTPEDGLPLHQIEAAERRLGTPLPLALREYYRVAGNLDELNTHFNQLRPLEELEFEDDYLLFMDENQAVVLWAIPEEQLALNDPTVWQRAHNSPDQWYSEEQSISRFLQKMFLWSFGLDDD